MQTAQGNMLEALLSVQSFLDTNASALAGVVNSGTRTKLLAAIADLEVYGEQQAAAAGAAKNATKVLKALRQTLIGEHMNIVSRIGRTEPPGTPEMANLKMPRGNPSTTRLAAAAYEMADSAQSNVAVFVAAGLPADFAAQLKGATDAMLLARHQRNLSVALRSGATTGLKTKLSASRKLVLVLDSMIRKAIKGDTALIENWRVAQRVRLVPFTPTLTPTAPSTPIAPASTT
jgi:hypothetical protein